MITLLASLAGFVSSILPDLIRVYVDKNDKKHELNILDRQMEMAKSQRRSRLEEVGAQADISETRAIYHTYKTGINWVDALNGTVRPVLAYAFFTLYSVVKLMQYCMIPDAPTAIYLEILWTAEDQAIFAGIISFYYGQRTLSKMRGLK